MQILNTTNRPRTIKTDTVLAMVDIATDIKMKGEKNTHEEEVFNLDNSALSGENKSNFLEMLHRNRWTFATDISELGHCKDLPMKIEIEPGNTPLTTRPYRALQKIQGIIDEQIKEMLDAGVIEESDSPYSSPIVMVKKRSGSHHMCIDFRKINAIFIKCPFPCVLRVCSLSCSTTVWGRGFPCQPYRDSEAPVVSGPLIGRHSPADLIPYAPGPGRGSGCIRKCYFTQPIFGCVRKYV